MANLTLFNDNQQFTYNWELIEDESKRQTVQTTVEEYQKKFETNRKSAEQIIVSDTLDKAKAVRVIKEELSHGQFLDVVQQTMNLNKNNASAYVNIANRVEQGADSEDVLFLVSKMEAVAANKVLKSSETEQQHYVNSFKATGKVPSQHSINSYRQSQKSSELNEHNRNRSVVLDWSGSGYGESVINTPKRREPPASSQTIETQATSAPEIEVENEVSVFTPEAPTPINPLINDVYRLSQEIKELKKSFLSNTESQRGQCLHLIESMKKDIERLSEMSYSAKY